MKLEMKMETLQQTLRKLENHRAYFTNCISLNWKNLKEMYAFLDVFVLPKLKADEVNNLNRPKRACEIGVIKSPN